MSHCEMTGAEMVIEALADQGVEHIFGYPGGAVLPIYDEMFQQEKVKHILVRQEQGAVHAAEGYARSTGKVGCVLVTSGPGATNAVTGLTDALMDSIPLVCITGQVPTHLIGNDAFQECDTVGITRPCTKHNWLVKNVDDLPASCTRRSTSPAAAAPVRSWSTSPRTSSSPTAPTPARRTCLTRAIGRAQGRPQRHRAGRRADGARQEAAVLHRRRRRQFRAGGQPALARAGAAHGLSHHLDADGAWRLPGLRQQWLGMLGMHGTYEANIAMHDCDVMICIGARFDDRITGRVDAFSPGSTKIHIDIDPSSINKNVRVDVPIVGDVAYVLEEMIAAGRPRLQPRQDGARKWWAQIDKWRAKSRSPTGTPAT